LAETEYLIMLAGDLRSWPSTKPLLVEVDEIARMLYTLRKKVVQSER